MVSQYRIKLTVHLITNHFGNLVSKVCETLLRRGVMTWEELVRFTELTREQVKNSLLVLIQHNCVQAFVEERDGLIGIFGRLVLKNVQQTMTRHSEEYRAALQRAVTLNVPDAFSPSQYGTFDEAEEDESSVKSNVESSTGSAKNSTKNETWDELIGRLLDSDESGHPLLKKAQKDS